MRIASWNVNSIAARLPHVTAWLTQQEPDVLCLQEIKTVVERFPADTFAELGYRAVVFGQPGDLVLLGSRTLEGLNFRVEPVTKRLVDAGPAPAAAAA